MTSARDYLTIIIGTSSNLDAATHRSSAYGPQNILHNIVQIAPFLRDDHLTFPTPQCDEQLWTPTRNWAASETKMADEQIALEGQEAIKLTGDRLREAREALGLTLADVAQRTRITQRHLRAVEESQFSELPGRTYVTGFSRAYARAINLPEAEIAAAVRRELEDEHYTARPIYEAYEPTDPARLPTKRLAITFVVITALLASAYGVWRFVSVEPDEALRAAQMRAADENASPTVAAPGTTAPAGQTPAGQAIAADAPVILTAVGNAAEVWIGFDDAQGKARDSRTLKAGEHFQLPADYVANYTLRTSRPQALQITVGGRDIGSLGSADLLVKNVSLKVADLIARADSNGTSTAPVPAKAPTATPPVAPAPTAPAPAR